MNTEQQYITGFNNGYILSEHEPKLLRSIAPSLQPSNKFLEGLLDGKHEMELQKMKVQFTELEQLRTKNLARSKDFERD